REFLLRCGSGALALAHSKWRTKGIASSSFPLDKEVLVIHGPSGSGSFSISSLLFLSFWSKIISVEGKTQLFYAALLFFRAHYLPDPTSPVHIRGPRLAGTQE